MQRDDKTIIFGEGSEADKLIGCSVDRETGYYFMDIYQLGEPRPYGWVSPDEKQNISLEYMLEHRCSLAFAPTHGAEVLRGLINMLERMLEAIQEANDVGFE